MGRAKNSGLLLNKHFRGLTIENEDFILQGLDLGPVLNPLNAPIAHNLNRAERFFVELETLMSESGRLFFKDSYSNIHK